MRIFIKALFVFFTSTASFSPPSDKSKVLDILQKCQKIYMSTDRFQLNMKYSMYAGSASAKSTESYQAFYLKYGHEAYSKIGNTEFIELKDCFIKADHESNLMMFGKRDKPQSAFYNLNDTAKYFNSFNYVERGNQITCTLSTPGVSLVPYSKIVIYINKSTFQITRQVMFLLDKVRISNKNGKAVYIHPRMQIDFYGFKAKGVEPGSRLLKSTYVTTRGAEVVPAAAYKNFTIVD